MALALIPSNNINDGVRAIGEPARGPHGGERSMSHFLTLDKQTTIWTDGLPARSGTVAEAGLRLRAIRHELALYTPVKWTLVLCDGAPSAEHQMAVKIRRLKKIGAAAGLAVTRVQRDGALACALLTK
jgi:hypothetical protein